MASAGTPPVQADLAVSVSVTPSEFSPGSHGSISLTLNNHGPDTAGTGAFSNLVFQRGFRLEVPTDRPPYDIRDPVIGCFVVTEIVGPFSDLSFGLVWSYYFDVIAPGTSRTCTFPIEFYPQPFENFDTFWITALSTEDPNPSNNRVDYRFVAGTPFLAPTPVPTMGLPGLMALLSGLGWLGLRHRMSGAAGVQPRLTRPGIKRGS
jgi:hypothetical protein